MTLKKKQSCMLSSGRIWFAYFISFTVPTASVGGSLKKMVVGTFEDW